MNETDKTELYPYAARIESFLTANPDWSQNRLAREMDVSAGQLSQYRRRILLDNQGNLEKMNNKINAWFRAQDKAAEFFEEGILDLRITTEIQTFISIAHGSKECALLFGGAGLGKTIALKQYVEKDPYASLVTATNAYGSDSASRWPSPPSTTGASANCWTRRWRRPAKASGRSGPSAGPDTARRSSRTWTN